VVLHNAGGTFIDLDSSATSSSVFWTSALDSLTLWPGDSVTFVVYFRPPEVAEYRDTVAIGLYYGDDLKVPLSGQGTVLGLLGESMSQLIKEISIFPNPFNPIAELRYALARNGDFSLALYDVQGSPIAILASGYRPAGVYTTAFDGSHLPSGIYFARLVSAGSNSTVKLILMK